MRNGTDTSSKKNKLPGARTGWPSRKVTALVLLTVQNASVSLLTRQSRRRTKASEHAMYAPAVAVFVAEVMKASVSLYMLALEKRHLKLGDHKKSDDPVPVPALGDDSLLRHARQGLVDTAQHTDELVRLSVPAALYATQNVLLYVALSNLSAPTYASTYQLKLLTAALFSILFFKRTLSIRKWTALFLLTAGVAVVQLDNLAETTSGAAQSIERKRENPSVGFAAILAACVSSGLAGSWFEYILKSGGGPSPSSSSTRGKHRATPSLWARNLQLSFPSLAFSLVGVLISKERHALWTDGPLRGFTPLVWSVVVNQAVGGLLVALVTREADSVAKGFATSMAIVLSTMANCVIFGVVPGLLFLAGAGLVIVATLLYAM